MLRMWETTFLTWAVVWGEWSSSLPRWCTPGKRALSIFWRRLMKNTHCRFPVLRPVKQAFWMWLRELQFLLWEPPAYLVSAIVCRNSSWRYNDADLCCSHSSIWCYMVSEMWQRFVERSFLCAPSRDHIELACLKADQLSRRWSMIIHCVPNDHAAC